MTEKTETAQSPDKEAAQKKMYADFRGAATFPDAWLARATSLIDFAESLATEFLHRVKTNSLPPNQWEVGALSTLNLWTGCAIENSLKAVLVKRGEIGVEDGKLTGLVTHRLLKLAEAAKFDLTDEKRAHLDRLTEVVIWESRYAFPKDAETWAKAQISHPSSTDVTTSLGLAKEIRDWADAILAVNGPLFKISERLS